MTSKDIGVHMKYLILVVGFAFTVSYFDGCGKNEISIKGPFPTVEQCNHASNTYSPNKNYNLSKCWKIPEES